MLMHVKEDRHVTNNGPPHERIFFYSSVIENLMYMLTSDVGE